MRPWHASRFSIICVLAATLALTACSKSEESAPEPTRADDSIFDQVAPGAFEGIDDPKLRDELAIGQDDDRGPLIVNPKVGLTGRIIEGRFVVFDSDKKSTNQALQLTFNNVSRLGETGVEQLSFGAGDTKGNVHRRRSGNYEEYFVNRAEGIEHGLVLAERPDGEGRVTVDVEVGGGYKAYAQNDFSAVFHKRGQDSISYRNLRVFDANKRPMSARMWAYEADSGQRHLRISIDDRDAVYPVLVDPVLAQASPRLWPESLNEVASCAQIGDFANHCGFGFSTAVYNDFMVVGVPQFGAGAEGAVHVFERVGPPANWRFVRTIVSPNIANAVEYGFAVAIWESAPDNYVIVVGDPAFNGGIGRVWVHEASKTDLTTPGAALNPAFEIRSGSGQTVLGNGAFLQTFPRFGFDVATNGQTIAAGAPGEDIVFIIDRDTGTGDFDSVRPKQAEAVFGELQKLGFSVAMNDTYVVAGAPETIAVPGQIKIDVVDTAAADYSFQIVTDDAGTSVTDNFPVVAAAGATADDIATSIATTVSGQPGFSATASAGSVIVSLPERRTFDSFTPAIATPVVLELDTAAAVAAKFHAPYVMAFELATSTRTDLFDDVDPNSALLRTQLGYDVAVSSTTIVAGAPKANIGAGFTSNGTGVTWDIAAFSAGATTLVAGLNTGDRLGQTVAVRGTDVWLGAPVGGGVGSEQAGYVIKGAGGAPFVVESPINNGTAGTTGFRTQTGHSLAIDPVGAAGDELIVGVPGYVYYNTPGGSLSAPHANGAIATFEPVTGTLTRLIAEPESTDGIEFGYQVDIEGNTMVVSAPTGANVHEPTNLFFDSVTGVVYVYERGTSDEDWVLKGIVEADVNNPDWQSDTNELPTGLGPNVAVSTVNGEPMIAVEVTYAGTESGVALVFWDAANLKFQALDQDPLLGPDYVYNTDQAISDIDFDGDYLVVGSAAENNAAIINVSWAGGLLATLNNIIRLGNNLTPGVPDGFGQSVAVSSAGGFYLVGAPPYNTNQGEVIAFTLAGIEVGRVSASPDFQPGSGGTAIPANSLFGSAIAVQGSTALVAAPEAPGGGAAYLLDFSGTEFAQKQILERTDFDNLPTGPNVGAFFGASLDIDSNSAFGPIAIASKGDNRVATYTYNSTTGLYVAGNWTAAPDPTSDLSFPGDVAIVPHVSANTAALLAAVGVTDSKRPAGDGGTYDTGSVVFLELQANLPEDTCGDLGGAPDFDDDFDGVADEDGCAGGAAPDYCVAGECADPCLLSDDYNEKGACPINFTCQPVPGTDFDPNLATTTTYLDGYQGYCKADEPCTGTGETLVAGVCVPTCTGDANCVAGGEICYIAQGQTEGFCAPDGNPCQSDGATCGIGLNGQPESCFQGVCYDQCANDSECAAGEKCNVTDGVCTPQDPCAATLCRTDESCFEGSCFEDCNNSGDVCDDTTKTCYLNPDNSGSGRCADSADPCSDVLCPPDADGDSQICYEGACYPGCMDDVDCAPPNICYVGGFCAPPDPCDDVWCGLGEVCYEGACYGGCSGCGDTCYVGGDSTQRCAVDACEGILCPLGQDCMNGLCYTGCNVDSDCGETYLCEDACAIPGAGSDCALSGATLADGITPATGRCLPDPCDAINCPSGETCVDGGCRTSCTAGTCPDAGDVCYDGGCIADPCASDPCGGAETCYAGACYPDCGSSTCPTTTDICLDGRCTQGACSGVDCPLGQVCFEGGCFDPCLSDGDCTPPNLCVNNVCASDPCEGIECPLGEVCYGGSCAPTCGSTTDCGSDVDCSPGESCQNINPETLRGFCINCDVSEECFVKGCQDDGDCPGTLTCQKNGVSLSGACMECDPTTGSCDSPLLTCRTDACEGVQCPLGEVCFEGACFEPCSDNGDCTPPNSCYNGYCTTDLCRGVQCPLGQVCFGGGCYDPCLSNDDCSPPATNCYDGRCAVDACAESSSDPSTGTIACPLGDICINGGCFEGCSENTDCSDYVGTGDFVDVASSISADTGGGDKEGGIAWFDSNNDGWLDSVSNADGWPRTRILTSDGNAPDPSFYNDTGKQDYMADNTRARSVVTGDLDNDGDVDVVRNDSSQVEIFLNRGSTGEGYSPWSFGVGWPNSPNYVYNSSYNGEGLAIMDYDGDKDLDIMSQEGDELNMWRNNLIPNGTLSWSWLEDGSGGIGDTDNDEPGDYCAVADYDVDGDVDVYCRFEKTDSDGRDLFQNDGDGTFTRMGEPNEDGRNGDKSGVVFCDYDNDGDFDLFHAGKDRNQWWRNDGGSWQDTGKPDAGSGHDLNQGKQDIFGVDCGDVDNDGDMDLFIAHEDEDRLYINQLIETGSPDFVYDLRGIDDGSQDTLSGIMVDYDNDGDLDISTNSEGGNRLWRNPLASTSYMMIKPVVNLGSTTRIALGATITIRTPDGATVLGVREANGGSGRGSQRPTPVHVGLQYGDNVPYLVQVRYPHGAYVEKCIQPNSMTGYRIFTIADTDTDDPTPCAGSDWPDDIIVPSIGEFCFQDRCSANACDNVTCNAAEVCVGGSCVPSCSSDAQCPAGEICYLGRCADAANPECDKVQCPSNQTCYKGECFRDCASSSDCGGGEFCYQGRCAQENCSKLAGGKCGLGQICHLGTCYESCTGLPGECPAGESCFEGRCATDGCAAMMVDYQTNHIFNVSGKKLTADQYSRPFMWPRPIKGTTNFATYAAQVGGSSTTARVHAAQTARVAVYLDPTLADGDNPDGRYVIWLTHGDDVAGQGAARANYQVRLVNPSDGQLNVIHVDDANEAHRVVSSGGTEILIASITSQAATTGGIAFGPFSAARDDWSVTIDAAFSGDINRWELYNPENYGSVTAGEQMKMGEQLTIRGLPMGVGVELAPESGMPCTMAVEAALEGNCTNGVTTCSNVNFGFPRCDQAVFPTLYEICDGEDNNCIDGVDEMTDPLGNQAMAVPYAEFNQNDGWKYWVPADSTSDYHTDMNFAPAAGDDRVGSTNYIGLEGTPMQAAQKSLAVQHRDLVRGDLTIGFLHGAPGAAEPTRDVEMDLSFPGTATFKDAYIAYYDDATPGADSTPDAMDEGNKSIQMRWQMTNNVTRESDSFAVRPNWAQYATGEPAYFEVDFDGEDDNTNDWASSSAPLQWMQYQPRLAANQNELAKTQELSVRVRGRTMSSTFCPAVTPFTNLLTGESCELSRYTCNPGGQLECLPATSLAPCNICSDDDLDGFPAYDPALCPTGTDCNDQDKNIYPGAKERCNGLDDDCDGAVDVKENPMLNPAICPGGTESCGPNECDFANICVCPDGPEDPNDPPSELCYCGDALQPGGEPAEPASVENPDLFEDRTAACSSSGADPLQTDMPWWLALGAAALVWRRRRR